MHFILGSQSPRRKEILGYFDIPFEQISPDYNEDSFPFQGDPASYVQTLAIGKGESLQKHFPNALILTADTIVYREGKIYGKPKNKVEAVENLMQLVGKWHSVFTGVNFSFQGEQFSAVEETKVLFNSLTTEQIHLYQSKLHCVDKAGGYAIQGAGGLIVQRIEGCYYNVMGLPINTVHQLLLRARIDLWNWIKENKREELCQ